jgi:hypothetical protein
MGLHLDAEDLNFSLRIPQIFDTFSAAKAYPLILSLALSLRQKYADNALFGNQ